MSASARVDGLDWAATYTELDAVGAARTGVVLDQQECSALTRLYDDDSAFRSTIDMEHHRFGAGQYRYFAAPLPDLVHTLRARFWPHLLPLAREWAERRAQHGSLASAGGLARPHGPAPWPDDLDEWLEQCHRAGQTRPTPLLLRYGPGDWNALHRDLYGELVFPLQVVIGLDRPRHDFTGGEFVVVEQRPRAQSRATVLEIPQGHAVVFTTRDRPVRSARGWSDAPMRHGLSTVRSGHRHALGLVFHDAS